MFFAGFRALRRAFDSLADSADPRADLLAVVRCFRTFMHENQTLSQVMFARPFADFDPGREEQKAGNAVRQLIIGRVRRCVDAGLLGGNQVDVAHVLVSLILGLAATAAAGWLGTSRASIDRRWELAFGAVLDGLRPAPR